MAAKGGKKRGNGIKRIKSGNGDVGGGIKASAASMARNQNKA